MLRAGIAPSSADRRALRCKSVRNTNQKMSPRLIINPRGAWR